MNKQFKVIGALVLAAIIAFSMFGCEDPKQEPEPDPTTTAASVTSVTVTPASASVVIGGTRAFTAAVTGTNNPAKTVTWSIIGTEKHAETTINSDGLLSVSADETLPLLIVRATSTLDASKFGQSYVTITDTLVAGACDVCGNNPCTCSPIGGICNVCGSDPCVCDGGICNVCGNNPCTCDDGRSVDEGVTVSMNTYLYNVSKGNSRYFYAVVNGEIDQTVTWSIDETGKHADTEIKIIELGDGSYVASLYISLDETLGTLTIRATSVANSEKYGWVTVTVVSGPIERIEVSLAPGSPVARKGTTVQLTINITPSSALPDGYNPNDDIDWFIGTYGSKTDSQGSSINENGILTIGQNPVTTASVADCSYNRTGVKGMECSRCYIVGFTDTRHYTNTVSIIASIKSSNTFLGQNYKGHPSQYSNIQLFDLGDNRGLPRGQTKYEEVTSAKIINLTDLFENNVYMVYVNPTNSVINSTGSVTVNSGLSMNMSSNIQPNILQSKTLSKSPAADFNTLPAGQGAGQRTVSQSARSIMPLSDLVVGTSTRSFIDHYKQNITATLLATGTHSNIWVPSNLITTPQAKEIAAKFDIIYPVITDAFGYENGGGPEGDGGMDGDKKIQILIYHEWQDAAAGQVLGYFAGKDLNTKAVQSTSNEAEMFYMNSVALGDGYDFYGTLAHEFQHLINYNKNIKGLASPSWYNEMLSLMAEQLVAPFINTNPNPNLYYYSLEGSKERSMTSWYGSIELPYIYEYGEKSVFGGYLLRNYGGAALAKAISMNDKAGMESITDAIQEVNGATDPDFFTRFIEAIFFNKSDETILGKSLKTLGNSSTKTIGTTAFNIQGLDIEQEAFLMPSFSKTRPTTLQPYSVNVYIPDELRAGKTPENLSITVTPPAGGAKLFMIVR